MEKIYHKDQEIEVTEPEFDSIIGTLMIEGMIKGLNGEMYTSEESRKVYDEIISEVLNMKEEKEC